MNEHIKPIFEIVIPGIQSVEIKYWIYGGIGYASMIGKFYRKEPNSDVDLFVLDNDLDGIEKNLESICGQNRWRIRKTFLKSGRPKIELLIGKKERLSVVPVYKINEYVEFKFEKISKKYPLDVLTQIERHLEGYTFFTPRDNYLKDFFILYLDNKRVPYKPKRIEDGRYLLTKEEFKKYFPNHSYEKP